MVNQVDKVNHDCSHIRKELHQCYNEVYNILHKIFELSIVMFLFNEKLSFLASDTPVYRILFSYYERVVSMCE